MQNDVGDSGPGQDLEARLQSLKNEVHQGLVNKAAKPTSPAVQPAGDPKSAKDAAPGTEGTKPKAAGKKSGGRIVLRNVLIAAVIGGIAFGAVEVEKRGSDSAHPGTAAAAKPLAQTSKSAMPGTASAMSSSTATATASATASGSDPSASPDVQQIPLATLFPKSVKGTGSTVYTLVQSSALSSCTKSDMVGTELAGLFAQSSGCVGGEGALYKDAANDQFTAVIFTLVDPTDVVSILTSLASDPTDFEVAPASPPAGSNLANLPATSGIVQQFASAGNYLGVFMAQWSTGKTSDYSDLETLLTPLQNAVSANMGHAAGIGGTPSVTPSGTGTSSAAADISPSSTPSG